MMQISKLLIDYEQLPNLTFHEMNKRKDFIFTFKKQLEQWNTHLHDIVNNGQLFANSIQKLSQAVSGTIDYVEDFPEVVHQFLTLSQILNHISGIHKTGVLSIQEAFTSGFEELQANRMNVSSQKLNKIMDLMYEYGQVVTSSSSKKGRESIAKQGKIYNADSLQLLTKPGHFEKILMESKKQYIDAVNQENQAIHIELIDKIHSLYYSFHTLYAQTLKNINRFEGHIEISSQKNAARNIELTRRIKEVRNVNAGPGARRQTMKLDSAGGNTPEGVLLFQKKKATDFKLKYFWVHKKTLYYGKLKKKEGKVELEKKQPLMSLFLTNAKPVSGGNQFCFEIISPESKENYRFIAGTQKDLKSWIQRLNSCSQKFIEEYTPSRASYIKMRSNSSDFGGFTVKSMHSQSPEPFVKTQRGEHEDHEESKSSIIPIIQDPKTLADRFEQSVFCADCGTKRPMWMSSTFLVPLCLNCSSFHRQMGPKVSRVKSIKLDKLPTVLIETSLSLSQKKIFELLQQCMPPSKRITELEKSGQKDLFYFNKYESKKFIKPVLKPCTNLYLKSIQEHDISTFYALVLTDPRKLNTAKFKTNNIETTLLHECAKSGFIEGLVILFFHTGQSLDVLDSNHCNPSDVALVNNQVEILEVISSLLK